MENSISAILNQINSVVLGKKQQVLLALSCLLAKGHLLIEDLPGMGKTTLAHALAQTVGLSYQRIQFTSDLLPSDVIGISIFNQKTGFEFHQGPIFNHIVLADEINRASPKTQSALLEAMEEQQVSVDGNTYQLEQPFFVIATQNPLHHLGTFPLPESQLDRFLMRINIGFPGIDAERSLLQNTNINVANLTPCIDKEQLIQLQNTAGQVNVSDAVIDYIVALVNVSRRSEFSANPLSPRASKALLASAKAWAFIDGRDFVLPDDVKAVFASVCQHRLGQTLLDDETSEQCSQQILAAVDVLKPLQH